jgi:hypothetical protein
LDESPSIAQISIRNRIRFVGNGTPSGRKRTIAPRAAIAGESHGQPTNSAGDATGINTADV